METHSWKPPAARGLVRGAAVTALLVLGMSGTGCVERLLQIRSDPPGATAYVNGKKLGITPVDHQFTFYGTFDITLRQENYLSVRRLEKVSAPWYQYFPLDLVAEHLIPWKIEDTHPVDVKLEPVTPLKSPEDETRAKEEMMERLRAAEKKLFKKNVDEGVRDTDTDGPW